MNDEKELSCIPLERIFHCKSLREINFTWTAKFSSSRLLVNIEWSGGRDNKFWNYNFNIIQKTNKFELLKVKERRGKFPVWKWSHNSIVKAGLSFKLKSFSIKNPFCFSFWKWNPLGLDTIFLFRSTVQSDVTVLKVLAQRFNFRIGQLDEGKVVVLRWWSITFLSPSG